MITINRSSEYYKLENYCECFALGGTEAIYNLKNMLLIAAFVVHYVFFY